MIFRRSFIAFYGTSPLYLRSHISSRRKNLFQAISQQRDPVKIRGHLKTVWSNSFLLMFSACKSTVLFQIMTDSAAFVYPKPRRDDAAMDEYHGTKVHTRCCPHTTQPDIQVADPYKWMEDPDSTETAEFVTQQNAVSQPYINSCQVSAWARLQLFSFHFLNLPGKRSHQEGADWSLELREVWLPPQGGGQVLLLQKFWAPEPVSGVRAGLFAGWAQGLAWPQHLLGWWHRQPH